MSNGIYVALSASVGIEKNMEVTSNNLANVNSAGFKKDRAVFSSYIHKYKEMEIDEKMEEYGTPQDKSFVEVADVYTEYDMGSLKETGNKFDFAIAGDGFFQVQKGEDVFLQRAGNFSINSEGNLTAYDGAFVLGEQGEPIVLNPAENFHVNENGEIFQNGQPVGSFSMKTIDNKRWLEKVGDNRYVKSENGGTETDAKPAVYQGFLENSNVNMVSEMVEMIKIQRHYEAAGKAIKAYQTLDDKAIRTGSPN